jgi:hypothetical protein
VARRRWTRACSPVCTPPEVPDAVAFLREPVISFDAQAAQLVLEVRVDPYLRQLPTLIDLQNPSTLKICGIAPAKLGMCELYQTLDGNCTTTYKWAHPFYDTVANSGCFVELPSTTHVNGSIAVKYRTFETVKSFVCVCVCVCVFFFFFG